MSDTVSSIPANLTEKYLAQLSGRCVELVKSLAQCETQSMTKEERDAARIHAHSLKGTGRTYGYPDISTAGKALEDAIDAGADQTALVPLIRALIEICDEVMAQQKDAPPSAPEQKAEAVPAKPAAKQPGKKPMILIVDDDPAIRGMLQQLLSRDAEMLTAPDSTEAMAMIERNKPDLIVLDDCMPGIGGIDMLERLHAEGKPLPGHVVMLTANNRTPAILAGMSAGAVDYITKPFEPDRLVGRIRTLLKRLGMTILVADDDAAVRGLLQHKFRMMGFRLLYADNGDDAMRLMHEEKPQLAIIDRMMPGLDGLAVLKKIRTEAALSSTPVILLTAKRQNKDVVEGFHAGATAYIAKPFVTEEVVARAMRLMGIHEAA